MCLGGAPWLKLFRTVEDAANEPAALAQLSKGCTAKTVHKPDGSITYISDCEETAGAPITSRITLSGTPDDIRQHAEVVLKGMGPNGSDTVVSDSHMTYLGDCPANVKPGQVLTSDGKVDDLFAGPVGSAQGN